MDELTTLDRAIRLQKVELFSDLETDALVLIAALAKQIHRDAGEALFAENTPSKALYVLLSGQVEMSRGGHPMFTVGKDETIGNWALLDEQPNVVTATPVEESWLLEIDREDFYDLLADHTEITRRMFQGLVKRVRGLLTAGLANESGRPAGG
jgi:CRP-like cAMP-binding protein